MCLQYIDFNIFVILGCLTAYWSRSAIELVRIVVYTSVISNIFEQVEAAGYSNGLHMLQTSCVSS